jgi:hypothetical protein
MGDIPDELEGFLFKKPNLPVGCSGECKYDPITGDWVPFDKVKKTDKATQNRLEEVKVVVQLAKTSEFKGYAALSLFLAA